MLDGKLVKRHIVVKGLSHPVAVRPNAAVVVHVVAVGVAVARRIEPVARAVLAEFGVGEEAVDHLLVGVRRGVIDKGNDFFGCRRQPAGIQADAAHQGVAIGFVVGCQAVLFDFTQDECVDWVVHLCCIGNRGYCGALDRSEGPMVLPVGALCDPVAEQCDLIGLEMLVRIWRGHDHIRLSGDQALVEFAVFRVAGDDRAPAAAECRQNAFVCVESKVGFAGVLVGTVAVKAIVG